MIYLDHNATTPVDERVFEAMRPFLTSFYGNPSSLHRHGRVVRTAIDQAREQVAQLVGTSAAQIVFTSGGTEANNLVISGLVNAFNEQFNCFVGSTEHPSIIAAAQYQAAKKANRLEIVPVDENGAVLKSTLSALLAATQQASLLSVMQANNETGVLQDIKAIAEFTKAQHPAIFLHTDAVQSAGKVALNFDALGVDLMSLSAHKIYGPKGVGALCVASRCNLQAILKGGEQEKALRPGTENVAGIVGFGMAAQLAFDEFEQRNRHLLGLQARLESGLKQLAGVRIVGEKAQRLSNTTAITLEQTDGEMLLMQMDQKGIAISSGSACSSNSKAPSPVLKAMGYSDSAALSSVRISLGKDNTEQEIDTFLSVLKATQAANQQ